MELHPPSSICFLRHVQKQTVHHILRSDPVLYFMVLTGIFKSDYTDYTTCDFELLLGVLLYRTERLDWVEEYGRSLFVTGVTESYLGIFNIYIYT